MLRVYNRVGLGSSRAHLDCYFQRRRGIFQRKLSLRRFLVVLKRQKNALFDTPACSKYWRWPNNLRRVPSGRAGHSRERYRCGRLRDIAAGAVPNGVSAARIATFVEENKLIKTRQWPPGVRIRRTATAFRGEEEKLSLQGKVGYSADIAASSSCLLSV